jgi:aromatic-L-amino-acid decarboxylase
VEKAAIILGLGQENVVKIPTDSKFRMRPDALLGAIMQDRSHGKIPCAVVATVGTTATTSIDPVASIARITRSESLWLHVDAAYGGAMAVCGEYRWVLEGCEHADSLVVNPHKWLFTPMDCSVMYTRHPEALRAAFSLVPSYLMTPERGRARDLMDYGPALGRRFRSLKLWFVLRAYGSRGIAARVRHHVRLAELLQSWIAETPEWEQLAPAPMSVVLFRHHPPGMDDEDELRAHNESLLASANASGECFLSNTLVKNRYALRVAVGNIRTERRHLEGAWRRLQEAARPA